jgi:hypothetical protein
MRVDTETTERFDVLTVKEAAALARVSPARSGAGAVGAIQARSKKSAAARRSASRVKSSASS